MLKIREIRKITVVLDNGHFGIGEKNYFSEIGHFRVLINLLLFGVHNGNFNGVHNLWYCSSQIEVFLIFHFEMKNQKVVFLTTWVVELNFGVNCHKIWLKVSGGTKNQIN